MFTPNHTEAASTVLTVDLCSNMLDALSQVDSAEAALKQIDVFRRRFAGPGIFSIQLNVTTQDDPKNEIRLQRFYSSNGGEFPVEGRKRKTLTPWTRTLFVQRRVFVAEGSDALEQTFDDFALMRPLGLNAAVNVPLLKDNVCYATFNVFGTRGRWQPAEITALRLLALTAARWVSPAPGLSYSLETP